MPDYDEFSAWLLANGIAVGTARLYRRILHDYSQYSGGKEPDRLTVAAWSRELCRQNAPQTVNVKLAAVAKYSDYIGEHIQIKRAKVQRRTSIEHLLTLDEVERLIAGLDAAGHDRLATIARLLAKTGARISEVVRLRREDIDRGCVDMQTKGKVRRIYIPEPLRRELEPITQQLQSGDFVCRNRCGGQITARGAAKMLRRYAAEIGIPPEKVHPHAFRHFFAVCAYQRTGDINLVADLLGHADVRTTMIYLQKTQEEQHREIDKAFSW